MLNVSELPPQVHHMAGSHGARNVRVTTLMLRRVPSAAARPPV
jgi:hypothetical protein